MNIKEKIINSLDRFLDNFRKYPLHYCNICGSYVYDWQKRNVDKDLNISHQKCYYKVKEGILYINRLINNKLSYYMNREKKMNKKDVFIQEKTELRGILKNLNKLLGYFN